MARRRRQFNVFNLSFLDVIACGFGAVILFFMIINSQVKVRSLQASETLQNETEFLEEEIFNEQKRMVRIKNEIDKIEQEDVVIKGNVQLLLETIEKLIEEVSEYKNNTLAATDSIAQLQSEVEQLDKANKKMTAESELEKKQQGDRYRDFEGKASRQYINQLKLDGNHVLILVDSSSSMLGRAYIDVIRYRNYPDEMKVKAPKWRQTVNSVDWLTTRLTEGTKFQIYAFNETVQSVIEETNDTWLEVTDGSTIRTAVNNLRASVPQKGTSLINAFESIQQLDPPPDNIFLLTDGLPTQGKRKPSPNSFVKPEQRLKYFDNAMRAFFSGPRIPINVLLFPMDGDPDAAGAYWTLSSRSKGSFMAPSGDWP